MRRWFWGVLNILLFEEQQVMSERTIKNKLKVFRAMHDWTQEELARRVCVTRKTINTVEKGKYIPSTYLALKLAKVFQVPVEELFQLDSECIPEE
jgi:putative transcriptional regulator